MSNHELAEITELLPPAEREALVLRYWRRGDLTPLRVANSLARSRRAATHPNAETR